MEWKTYKIQQTHDEQIRRQQSALQQDRRHKGLMKWKVDEMMNVNQMEEQVPIAHLTCA